MSTRREDSSPWNSGDYITNIDAKIGEVHCTSGFGVHQNTGQTWLLTAGHCSHVGDTYTGYFTSDVFGDSCAEDWDKDITVICTPGYHRMFDGDPYTGNYKVVHGWGYHVVNELLCQSGSTSGVVCGLKTQSGDFANRGCDSDGDCFVMHGLIQAIQIDGQTAGQHGDSGGPVFSLMGDGVRAKGVLSAGEGSSLLFQDWADLIRIWGFYPVTQ
jgi:hypothetical protein